MYRGAGSDVQPTFFLVNLGPVNVLGAYINIGVLNPISILPTIFTRSVSGNGIFREKSPKSIKLPFPLTERIKIFHNMFFDFRTSMFLFVYNTFIGHKFTRNEVGCTSLPAPLYIS